MNLKGVNFACPAALDRFAIAVLDFSIAADKHVAIDGPNGADKSTIFYLLLRFYDPLAGAVQVREAIFVICHLQIHKNI